MVIKNFIIRFPTTSRQHDSIMIVVEKLSKSTHCILVYPTHKTDDITRIFTREIFKLYGLSKIIVVDKDTRFTSKFWKSLFKDFGLSSTNI